MNEHRRWHIPLAAIVRMALLVIVGIGMTACSKTVQWEEEVPLNTGETIWVKRRVDYVLKGGAGNPLDIAYGPEWAEVLEFEWQGKNYIYEGEANIFLLAISPQGLPILVARAADSSWDDRHVGLCTMPAYVQFVPDSKGKKWTWPPSIEPWLYGMSANLMVGRNTAPRMQKRYTVEDRNIADGNVRRESPSLGKIDPNYVNDRCKGKI